MDLADLVGLHLVMSKIAGKGQLKFMIAGMGWATAELVMTRLVSCYFDSDNDTLLEFTHSIKDDKYQVQLNLHCGRISHAGTINNVHSNKTYIVIMRGTYQSNNLIYCLECSWCNTSYIGKN